MIASVTHPGPANDARLELVPCAGRPVALTLRAGRPLEDAVGEAMAEAGLDSAWLEIAAAPVSRLDYVIPALSPDADHVAWYSDIRALGGPGRIDRLGMVVGTHDGASFLHGHGLWTPDGGRQAMGHILAPRTELARDTPATGIGVTGARFARGPDTETNFDLFHATGDAADDARHALLRTAPNQDFAGALDAACARLGWQAARVHGLGSLIDARFADGVTLGSLPSEFLVLDADARADAADRHGPEIVIVGTDGDKILQGAITRGDNPVLITAELVLERTA